MGGSCWSSSTFKAIWSTDSKNLLLSMSHPGCWIGIRIMVEPFGFTIQQSSPQNWEVFFIPQQIPLTTHQGSPFFIAHLPHQTDTKRSWIDVGPLPLPSTSVVSHCPVSLSSTKSKPVDTWDRKAVMWTPSCEIGNEGRFFCLGGRGRGQLKPVVFFVREQQRRWLDGGLENVCCAWVSSKQ